MNRKEKGFTLVELIAVIILLGIIALIAIPTVNELLKEARKEAFEDSAYGLVRAGTIYYQKQELKDEVTSNVTFTFPEATGLEVSGKKPSSGTMVVDIDGNVQLAVSNGRYCARKGFKDSEITIDTDIDNCEISIKLPVNPYITSTHACATDTSMICSDEEIKSDEGILVNVQVNESENYDFYVVSDTGSELTLIMDRNLGNTVAWYEDAKDNSYGPITALNYLNGETAGWTNISSIESYAYDNNLNGTTYTYGYQKLEITNGEGLLTSKDGNTITELTGTSRARLLTQEEASSLGCTETLESCPNWIYGNLHTSEDQFLLYAYWLLTANVYNNYAWSLDWQGFLRYIDVVNDRHVAYAHSYGVRPVIKISKNLLS